MTGADHPQPSCPAITTAGDACRARPRPGRPVCFAHDDELAEIRADARRRGGTNKATVVRLTSRMPDTVAGMVDDLLVAMREVHAGDLEAARGQAIASLARAVLAAHAEHDVTARLDALEDHLTAVGRPLRSV